MNLRLAGWCWGTTHHSEHPEKKRSVFMFSRLACQVAASIDHLFLNSSLFRALSLQFKYSNRLEPAAPPIQD